jgi:hypothetical protein
MEDLPIQTNPQKAESARPAPIKCNNKAAYLKWRRFIVDLDLCWPANLDQAPAGV